MDIDELLTKLTINEKIALLSGDGMWHLKHYDKLGLPKFMMTDGPHGLRKPKTEDPMGIAESFFATCYPTASLLACSFDVDLMKKLGIALGNEAISQDVSMILGPGINVKRSPLCGRNFEYFSEDPLVSGLMGKAYIEGVQSKNVGTCLKHYLANNQEKNRMTIDTIVDKRALYELYLKGFEIALKAKPWALMTSYNKVNGTYVAESKYFLQAIARNRFEFKGAFITDWGAMNNRLKSFKSGLNLEMPGSKNNELKKAYKNHDILESEVDRAVKPVLWMLNKASEPKTVDKIDYHDLAKKIALESIVLLKNESVLPLKTSENIHIIGEFAEKPRIQGSGSSMVNPRKVTSLLEVFKESNVNFTYQPGYFLEDLENTSRFEPALNGVKNADKVVFMLGLPESFESEGFDRTHLNLPHIQLDLLNQLIELGKEVIVVLQGGAPSLMPYKDKVKGIINMYLAGESGYEALFEIIFGRTNPSGKLAETYPIKLDDCSSTPFFPGGKHSVYYAESIYVGYRYYDKKGLMVNYPFGYGLSYSEFEYSNLVLTKKTLKKKDHLIVKVDVENKSNIDGKEVIQVYVSNLGQLIHTPSQELKAFKKVMIKAKEKVTVEFDLSYNDFSYFDVDIDDFRVHQGNYAIKVGSSSRDLNLVEEIVIHGDDIDPQPNSVYDTLERYISTHDFEEIYGHLPPKDDTIHHKFELNSTIGDIKQKNIGKLIYKIGIKEIKKANANEAIRKMMIEQFESMPLRAIPLFSHDKISLKRVKGIIKIMNKDLTGVFMLL